MNKTSPAILTILLAALIMLSGCGGTTSKEGSTTSDVSTGKQAMQLAFISGYPTSSVTKGDPVDIQLIATNYGKDTVDATIALKGLPSGTQTRTVSIEGKEITRKTKESTEVNFGSTTLDFEANIRATACYSYQTTLSDAFCYQPIGEKIEGTCTTADNPNLAAGQGAPVAISSVTIEPKGSGEKARVRIIVKNVGGGYVRNPSDPTIDCDSRKVEYENIDQIRVDRISFGSSSGVCRPLIGNLLKLEGGQGEIVCDFDGLPTSKVLVQLQATLSYGYVTQSESKVIKVET